MLTMFVANSRNWSSNTMTCPEVSNSTSPELARSTLKEKLGSLLHVNLRSLPDLLAPSVTFGYGVKSGSSK